MLKIGFDAKRIFHNTTGLGNYGRDLIRILSTHYPGNEYHLFNPKKPKIQRLDIKDNIFVHLPGSFIGKFLPSLWRSKWVIKDLEKHNIQLYHGLSGELPWGISQTNIPSIVTIHDLIFMRFPQLYKPLDRKIYFKKFLRAVHEADMVVAISAQTKSDILQFSDIKPEKIKVIYQGCHPVFKKKQPDEFLEEVRRKYHLPDEFLLQVGTVEPRKNAFTVVKALKDLPYHFVLVGRETPYAKEIKSFVQKNGMKDRIHFLQNLDLREIAALYQLARVSVYPSIFEGFGIPIIESLYSGTPVITNRQGVFPEAAGPGGIYLENVENTGEMKEKIRWSMENDLSGFIRAGKEYIQKFNDDVLAEQWMKLYHSLM